MHSADRLAENARRGLSQDVPSLYKLIEEHDDEALHRMIEISDTLQGQQGGSNFMEVANSVSARVFSCSCFDIWRVNPIRLSFSSGSCAVDVFIQCRRWLWLDGRVLFVGVKG